MEEQYGKIYQLIGLKKNAKRYIIEFRISRLGIDNNTFGGKYVFSLKKFI